MPVTKKRNLQIDTLLAAVNLELDEILNAFKEQYKAISPDATKQELEIKSFLLLLSVFNPAISDKNLEAFLPGVKCRIPQTKGQPIGETPMGNKVQQLVEQFQGELLNVLTKPKSVLKKDDKLEQAEVNYQFITEYYLQEIVRLALVEKMSQLADKHLDAWVGREQQGEELVVLQEKSQDKDVYLELSEELAEEMKKYYKQISEIVKERVTHLQEHSNDISRMKINEGHMKASLGFMLVIAITPVIATAIAAPQGIIIGAAVSAGLIAVIGVVAGIAWLVNRYKVSKTAKEIEKSFKLYREENKIPSFVTDDLSKRGKQLVKQMTSSLEEQIEAQSRVEYLKEPLKPGGSDLIVGRKEARMLDKITGWFVRETTGALSKGLASQAALVQPKKT